jgi:hypothetical protein
MRRGPQVNTNQRFSAKSWCKAIAAAIFFPPRTEVIR